MIFYQRLAIVERYVKYNYHKQEYVEQKMLWVQFVLQSTFFSENHSKIAIFPNLLFWRRSPSTMTIYMLFQDRNQLKFSRGVEWLQLVLPND